MQFVNMVNSNRRNVQTEYQHDIIKPDNGNRAGAFGQRSHYSFESWTAELKQLLTTRCGFTQEQADTYIKKHDITLRFWRLCNRTPGGYIIHKDIPYER